MASAWPWRARVPGVADCPDGPVHDGDTLTLLLDRGFDDLKLTKIRLISVYAPELKQPGGTATKEFVVQWLLDHQTKVRWPFWLDTFRTSGDLETTSLSRYLGMVWTADHTSCLNTEINAFVADHGYGQGNKVAPPIG